MLLLFYNEELFIEMEFFLNFFGLKCIEIVFLRKMRVFMSGLWLLKMYFFIMKVFKSIIKWNSLEERNVGRNVKIILVIIVIV